MRKQLFMNLMALAAICMAAGGCASTNGSSDSAKNIPAPSHNSETAANRNFSSFSDVIGKDLKLIEVYIETPSRREMLFNRDELHREGSGDIYTLNFDTAMVSGVGAPNRYSAPYTQGQGQVVTIGLMRSTLMASLFEPEKLPEHQYFQYMQNVYEWRLNGDKLEFLSRAEGGIEIRLIFK